MVGLLGRVISPSQGLYLHRTQHRKTRTNIQALSRIRTHDPSNQPAKTHASDRTATVTGRTQSLTVICSGREYKKTVVYLVRFQVITAANMKVFWDVVPCSLVVFSFISALMTEAVITPETSVNFYEAIWTNFPEDNHIHSVVQLLRYMILIHRTPLYCFMKCFFPNLYIKFHHYITIIIIIITD
jgi:hypothetical protein